MVKTLNILLIDDDDVACESVIRSFKKFELKANIVLAHDGVEGLDILRGNHPTKTMNKPFLILLDLNMPRMNGFEFLEEMRSDKSIASNVVFVLTTSSDDNDRARAYDNYIAGYMVKSAVGPQFNKLFNLLQDYRDTVVLSGDDHAE